MRAWPGCTRWTIAAGTVPLTYWRSRSQLEVDFVVGDAVAIEVKAKSLVSARDYRGLLALAEEVPLRRKLVVCHEPCLPCVWHRTPAAARVKATIGSVRG